MTSEPGAKRRFPIKIIAPATAAVIVAILATVLALRPASKPAPTPSPAGTLAATPSPTATHAPTLTGFPYFAATVKGAGIDVRHDPDPSAQVFVHLKNVDENGAPQTFLIEHEGTGTDGAVWYNVLLPIKPNGSKGWIKSPDVKTSGLTYHLVIHLKSFKLDLDQASTKVLAIPIGVGTQNTPTPSGEYYIKELIKPPNQNTIYGHFVFGLNGFSNVLVNWPGGGVLGIHGTNDERAIGKRVSHGCIRMSNHNIEILANLLPLGTPVKVQND